MSYGVRIRPQRSTKHSMGISSHLRALSTNEHVVMAVLSTMVGSAAGFGALGFRYLVGLFQLLSYGSHGNLLEVIHPIPWYLRPWVPALGGLVVGTLIQFFMKEVRGAGIADVMEAVALRKGMIKKRLLPVVAAENPKRLLGVVTRRDIIGVYNHALMKKSPHE